MANTENDSPASTPATRTKNGYFKHPSSTDGRVHYGDESWPIFAGVVECPLEVGEPSGWLHASEVQVKAFLKAKPKDAE